MEYYLSRGMDITPARGPGSTFAPNLSFPAMAGFRKASTYFSNGMDPQPCLRHGFGRQVRRDGPRGAQPLETDPLASRSGSP